MGVFGPTLANPISLRESAPVAAATPDTGEMFFKDVGGVTEMFYEDSDGTQTQITNLGVLNANSVLAATRVVAASGGTDTTIAAAISNLPAEGGLILVKEGTYTITSAIVMPNKKVSIIGSGLGTFIQNTTTGANVFEFGFAQDYTFANFKFTGSNIATQSLFYVTAAANIHATRVRAISQQYTVNTTSTPTIHLTDVESQATVHTWNGAGTGYFTGCDFDYLGTGGGIVGSPSIFAANTRFGTGLANPHYTLTTLIMAGGTFSPGGTVDIVNCKMTGSIGCSEAWTISGPNAQLTSIRISGGNALLTLSGSDAQINGMITGDGGRVVVSGVRPDISDFAMDGNNTGTIGLDILAAATNGRVVDGQILNHTTAGIRIASTGWVIDDIKFSESVPYLEIGAADNNRIGIGVHGFAGSTVIGPDTVVMGSRKKGVTGGITTDALVEQFTHKNLKGLLGIGTLKNTGGANSLDVKETAEDFFGITDSVTTTKAFGTDHTLSRQFNIIGTARPPYKSYKVEVKSTAAGFPTSFNLQHTSMGAE